VYEGVKLIQVAQYWTQWWVLVITVKRPSGSEQCEFPDQLIYFQFSKDCAPWNLRFSGMQSQMETAVN